MDFFRLERTWKTGSFLALFYRPPDVEFISVEQISDQNLRPELR